MKKCAFSSSFAGGDDKNTHNFSLLDSMLSLLKARLPLPDEAATEENTADGDDTRVYDDDDVGNFAKTVENAKNRTHGSGKHAKSAQKRQSDEAFLSENGENYENRERVTSKIAQDGKNRAVTQCRAATRSADKPSNSGGRENGEDYYSPPPCYRV